MRDGDEWVVNGQKIWTSLAQHSKLGILIARTDPDAPKHEGISYFICPMDAPGIEIRPIIEMTGSHTFNEVFFDRRAASRHENLVGEVNRGWGLAKVTLGNERVSLSSGGALWGMGPTAMDLLDAVRAAGGTADPVLRQRLAALHIEHELLRLIRLRTVTARIKGEPPGAEASIRKILADEHGQAIMGLAKDLAGASGMLTGNGPGRGARRHVALRVPVQPRAHRRRRHRRGAAQHRRRAGPRPARTTSTSSRARPGRSRRRRRLSQRRRVAALALRCCGGPGR